MRIISGKFRGTKIAAPVGNATRPTADRVRESIYNVLIHNYISEFSGKKILDAFAGSGSMGLEALSRGAAYLYLMESASLACNAIQTNIKACHAQSKTQLIRSDVLAPPLAREKCNLVFLDPPYGKKLGRPAVLALMQKGWLADDALILLEVGRKDDWEQMDGFLVQDDRSWGQARVLFLKKDLTPSE